MDAKQASDRGGRPDRGDATFTVIIFVIIHQKIYVHVYACVCPSVCVYVYMCICVYVCMYVCIIYVHEIHTHAPRGIEMLGETRP